MKKSITSNWRPPFPASYLLIIAIAVLWVMPKNARAQLYVSQQPFGKPAFVSEYNASTGKVRDRHFIPELNGPRGLAVFGPTEFPDGFLFVADLLNDEVGKYDAKTGAPINASFITGIISPDALAVLDDSLFVAHFDFDIDEVGKYNASTGAPIKVKFITRGLNGPIGLAVLGNTLFVLNLGGTSPSGTVGKYDAIKGAVINATLITGLDRPSALAVKAKAEHGFGVVDEVFVADRDGTVSKYDAKTGGAINAPFIKGLHEPSALAVLGDTLFVASLGDGSQEDSGTVGTYNAKTGEAINAKFITGLNNPSGLAVKSPK
jgi:hypothetical protein